MTSENAGSINVATGMEIREGDKKIGNVVLYGDVYGIFHNDVHGHYYFYGDGEADANDGVVVSHFLEGDRSFDDYMIVAMDVNHDGVIDYKDANILFKSETDDRGWYGGNIEQNYEAANVDSLAIIDVNYVINEYIEALAAKNNGYSITKEENGYVLNGVQSGITVQTLLDALPENTVYIRMMNPRWVELDPTTTIVPGKYDIRVLESYLGSDSSTFSLAGFVVE